MGFSNYQFTDTAKARELKHQINPVWRGIGCLLVLGLSVTGYLFAGWFLRANLENGWIFLPSQLIYPPNFPAFLPPGFIVRIVVAFLFMIFSYGALSFVYALLFPKQLGETDAPPIRRRRRRQGDPWRSRSR